MELQILLLHEKYMTKELQQAKQILISFIEDDGRDALMKRQMGVAFPANFYITVDRI